MHELYSVATSCERRTLCTVKAIDSAVIVVNQRNASVCLSVCVGVSCWSMMWWRDIYYETLATAVAEDMSVDITVSNTKLIYVLNFEFLDNIIVIVHTMFVDVRSLRNEWLGNLYFVETQRFSWRTNYQIKLNARYSFKWDQRSGFTIEICLLSWIVRIKLGDWIRSLVLSPVCVWNFSSARANYSVILENFICNVHVLGVAQKCLITDSSHLFCQVAHLNKLHNVRS